MEHDEGKIDETVLALLYLTTFKDGPSMRAWNGPDWVLWNASTKPVILPIRKTRPSL
jgi:hypothetical protein